MTARRILLPAIALLGLTACEGWENFDLDPYMPKVHFQELVVQDVDWEGVDADFVFAVENPNPVDVSMARFDYALAFEDIEWLAGDDPDGLVLAAEGSSDLALPVSIEFASLWEMVQAVRGQDDIGFGLDGSFGFDTPLGPLDIPYEELGGFPAPRKPTVTLNRLKLKQLDLQGADLVLKLDFDNDHGSQLSFLDVDWQVALAGVDIGGGLIDNLGTVEGASQQTLNIPIQVNFLDVGSALYQVLQGDDLKVDLAADMNVDTPFGLVPLQLDQSRRIAIER